jgi:hypothetical protein
MGRYCEVAPKSGRDTFSSVRASQNLSRPRRPLGDGRQEGDLSELVETRQPGTGTIYIESSWYALAIGAAATSIDSDMYFTSPKQQMPYLVSGLCGTYANEFRLRRQRAETRPISWSIGGWTPAEAFFEDVNLACRLDVDIGPLPSKHFQHVTIPNALANNTGKSA